MFMKYCSESGIEHDMQAVCTRLPDPTSLRNLDGLCVALLCFGPPGT